jgi:cytoskeleton protein RodZ
MSRFGENLRRKREARGVSLEEVAAATRIARRHLEALEHDELGSLPGGAFSRGYVRAYAEFLGIDPGLAVQAYLREEKVQGRGEPAPTELAREISRLLEARSEQRPRRRLRSGMVILIAAAALAVLLAAGLLWLRRERPASPAPAGDEVAAPSPPNSGSQPADAPSAAAPVPQPTSPAPPAASRPQSTGPASAATSDPQPTNDRAGAAAAAPSAPARGSGPQPTSPGPSATSDPQPTNARAGQAGSMDAAATSPPPAALPPGAALPPAGVAAPEVTTVAARLSVPDAGVGTGVVDLQLVGPASRFPEGSPVFFWARFVGGGRGDRVAHAWLHEGRTVASIAMTLGGPQWRTHSRKMMTRGSTGRWAVEARDAAGRLLARREFVCVPAEPSGA